MYPRALIVQAIFVFILKSAHGWSPPCSPCKCSELEEEGMKISECTAADTNFQLAKIPQLHSETEAVYFNGQQFNTIPEEVFFKGIRNNLKFIDLKNCQVRDIHVNAFKNLEHLSGLELSHNELTNLDENIFASNNNLRILILLHNKIKVLPENIFYNLPLLKYFDVSDNKLQHVYPNQFKNNINLERLILQTNYLSKFDSNIISNLQKLEVLYLDNNPWKCDCQTKDLQKYFIDHNIEYIDDDIYPICSQPRQWKGKTWLDIKPQELCSIKPKPKTKVTEGNLFGVNCTIETNTYLPVEWLLNGQPLDITNTELYSTTFVKTNNNYVYTLKIHKITPKDSGVYKCWTNTQDGDDIQSDETIVNVETGTKPNFPSPQDEQKLVRNGITNYRLKCNVAGDPLPQIQWFVDGNILIPLPWDDCRVTIDYTNNDLVFETFDNYCSGDYTCQATSPLGVTEKTFKLKISNQKPVIETESKINATEESFIDLQCLVAASEGLQVSWLRNGVTINSNNKYTITQHHINATHYDFNLRIKEVSLQDAGNYKCKADGNESPEYTVNVKSPVEIDLGNEEEEELALEPGQNKEVKCKIKGVKNAIITWEYPDCNKNTNVRDTSEVSTLELKDVKCSGQYKCIVKTPKRTYIQKFNLSVKKPSISIGSPITNFASGNIYEHDTINLLCMVENAVKSQPFWTYKNMHINNFSNMKINKTIIDKHKYYYNLVLTNISLENSGEYKCNIGTQQISQQINVQKYHSVKFLEVPNKITNVAKGTQNYKLKCKASGPEIDINWKYNTFKSCRYEQYKEEHNNEKTAVLVITVVLDSCTNDYSCEASNNQQNQKYDFKLNVVTLQRPNIAKLPDEITKQATENEEVVLKCLIRGASDIQPKWLVNGNEQHNHKTVREEISPTSYWFNLVIKNVRPEDGGNYKCVVGDFEDTTILDVNPLEKPNIEYLSKIAPIEAGKKNVRIISQVSGTPIPNATWHIPNGCKHEITRETTGESQWIYLTIKEVTKDCGGQYIFTAKNSKGEEKSTVDVEVLSIDEPPQTDIETLSNDKTPIENENIILKCFIKTRTYTPLWLRNGQVITNNNKYKIEIKNVNETSYWYNLHISKLSQQDKGSYKCKINNFESDVLVNIKPSTKPVLEYIPNIPPIEAGKKDVRIVSRVSGTPIPNATWHIPSGCKHDITRETKGDSQWIYLTINEVTKDCAGPYTFKAKNSKGEEKSTVDVEVLSIDERPYTEIDTLSNDKTPIENENIILKCFIKTRTYNPQWLRNGQVITNNNKYNIEIKNVNHTSYWYNLHIVKLSQQDKGSYKCKVNNFESDVLVNIKPSTKPVLEYIPNIPPIEAGKKDVRIVSRVSGTPIPNATWHIPSGCKHDITRETKGDSQWTYLTINEVTKDCAGPYTFKAKNAKGEVKSTVDVEVLSIDERPYTEINTLSNDKRPIENENIILKCFIKTRTYNPQWLRNGQVITNNNKYKIEIKNVNHTSYWYNLHISKLSQQDKGSYKCKVNNFESDVLVNIKPSTKPVLEYIPNIPPIEAGKKDVRIVSRVSGTPIPNATWHIPSGCKHDITRETKGDNQWIYLTINEVTKDCAGPYTFTAKNSKGEEKTTVDVEVLSVDERPHTEIETLSNDKTPIENENIILKCFIKTRTYNPEWLRNGQVITNNNKYKIDIKNVNQSSYWYNLHISKLSQQDKGSYTCKVNNFESDVLVNVKPSTKPVLEYIPNIPPIEAGKKNVRIVSRVSGAPIPNATWHIPSGCKHDITRETKGDNQWIYLTINEVTKDCAGPYTFAAKNSKGQEKTTVDVEVISTDTPPKTKMETLSNDTTPIENENIILKCFIKTRTYNPQWLRDGQVITNNNKYKIEIKNVNHTSYWYNLHISKLSQQDKGSYKCRVNNMESNIPIVDIKQSTRPFIEYISNPINVEEGKKDFTLSCKVNGIPKPKVSWQVQGKPVSKIHSNYLNCRYIFSSEIDNYTEWAYLTIRNVDPSCTGHYTCDAKNAKGGEQNTIHLGVISKNPPKIQPLPNKIYEGGNVTLNCLIKGNLDFKPYWIHNNKPVETNNKYRTIIIPIDNTSYWYNLEIKQVSSHEQGNYKCKVNDLETPVLLNILPSSKPELLPEDFEAGDLNLNETIKERTLPCRARGTPPPKIIWYYENVPLYQNTKCQRQIKIGNNQVNLILQNVGPSCAGKYKCVIENVKGKTEREVNVNINSVQQPIIQAKSDNKVLIPGGNFSIKCLVPDRRKYSAKWYRKNDLIILEPNGRYSFTIEDINATAYWHNLEISKLVPSDKGEYKCIINGIEGIYTIPELQQPVKPKIEYIPAKDLIIQEGTKDYRLACKVSGTPKPIVTWQFEPNENAPKGICKQSTPKISEDSELAYLVLEEVTPSCFGKYSCVTRNSAGFAQEEINLSVIPNKPTLQLIVKPNTPDGVIRENSDVTLQCLTTGTNAKVSWYYYRTLIKNGGKFQLSKQEVNPITTWHTLTVKNIQPQDKGTFTCKTGNSQQSYNLEIASTSATTVEYLVQPNLIVDENSNTVLSCKVSNIGDSFVDWTFNGDSIADSSCNSETDLMSESTERDLFSNLTIHNIDASCSGQFKCEVSNIEHTSVLDVTVLAGIEPEIIKEPNKDFIMQGEKIILKCFVTSGDIDSAKWYYKDIEIKSNDKYTITRLIINETSFWYNLEIPKAQIYQQGEYKCKSGNFENYVNVFINPEFKPIIKTISNPETIVQEGDDVTLVCKSDAWPPAIVNLKQKEYPKLCHFKETFDPKSQLSYIEIANVHISCAGYYVCTASNTKGEDTKYINLIVVPTKKPEITLNSTSSDGIIREGDTITLNCLVTDKKKNKAKWHGDGILNKNVQIKTLDIDPLTTRIELTVKSITLKQSGTYTCGTPELNNFKNILVTPGTSPTIDNIPDSIVTVSGTKSPTVYCKVSGFPKPNVEWFFNDRPVNLQNICKYKIYSNNHWYNMTIDNPISTCVGNYKCVASSTKGKTEKEVIVRSVQPQKPETKVITNNNDNIIKENDKITLNCLIKGDISIPVQWLYNGQPVQFNPNHKIIREPKDQTSFWYNLQINRASLQHNGNYQCKTPFSQSNISINVQKSRKPTIAISSAKVFIPTGKEQLITCTTDGIPIPSVTWQRNNKTVDICSHDCQLKTQEVTNNETGSRRLYLTVNSTESCSGKYKCIAENANGKIERSVDVVVISADHPNIHIREPVYPTLNTDVILCCEIESVDNPTISWKNQDKNIDYDRSKYDFKTVNVGNNLFISNLTIRNFQPSDMADYRCEAKLHNIYRSKRISLKPKNKFEPYFEHLPNLWNNIEINNNDLILINKLKSYPPPKWEWNLNSNANSSRNPRYKTAFSYINNDSYWFNVTISNFNENHDAGLYTFVVNNEIGKDEKRVYVDINGGSLQFEISQTPKGNSGNAE